MKSIEQAFIEGGSLRGNFHYKVNSIGLAK